MSFFDKVWNGTNDIHRPEGESRSKVRSDQETEVTEDSGTGEHGEMTAGSTPGRPQLHSSRTAHGDSAQRVDLAMQRLPNAFTPTRPKYDAKLFAGRHKQVDRIITAIEEDHAHVVLFGDRGRGKTSLANVVASVSAGAKYTVLKCTCSSHDTFEKVFRLFLRQIPSRALDEESLGARANEVDNAADLLPDGPFGPTELTDVLRHVAFGRFILLIDEFDRVTSDDLKGQLAEAIKNLSDASARVTLFIVGVAGNFENLIGMHPSIQRNLAVVHLPLMNPKEILDLLDVAEKRADIEIGAKVKESIAVLSRGLPYYAQLLGLYAARHALKRGVTQVDYEDLLAALDRAVEESGNQLSAIYDKAVAGSRGTLMHDVLFAASKCPWDNFGEFAPPDAAKTLAKINTDDVKFITLQRTLYSLTRESRGPILEKCRTARGVRYRFVNQVMPQYILARQVRERGIHQ